MPDWKIIRVYAHDGHLVFDVQHFHANGSAWLLNDYVFQGHEAFKHKRVVDALGKLLLDDNSVAPTRPGPDGDEQFTPAGREWKRETRPHMRDDSVTEAIDGQHRRFVVAGIAGGDYRMQGQRLSSKQGDQDGITTLLTTFQHLDGLEGTA